MNSVQSYVAAGWEGHLGEMDTCVCMAESLCCQPETLTTLLISYAPIYKIKTYQKNLAVELALKTVRQDPLALAVSSYRNPGGIEESNDLDAP